MEESVRRRWITGKFVAAVAAFGLVLAVAAFFVLPYFGVDNAIRLLVAEGVLVVTTALTLFGGMIAAQVRPRRRRIVIGALLAVCAAAAATFQIQWKGDMQQKPVPRQWVLGLLRRSGVDVGDVIHASRLASPPLRIEVGSDDSPTFLGSAGRHPAFPFRYGKLEPDWTAHPPREVWRKPIGRGWSSFAVAGKYGFTQEQTTDDQAEQVTCYDLTDGTLVWVHSDEGGHDWFLGGKGPRATPTFFDGRLFAVGSNGLLNCLDASTGALLWKHDLVAELASDVGMWGKSSSPLIVPGTRHGDLAVIEAGVKEGNDPERGTSLVAYKTSDGTEVWRSGKFGAGYGSPQLSTLGGVPQILIVHWQTVAGHDPETGEILWTYEGWNKGDPKVPQPIVVDDRRVLVSAGYGVGCRMLEVTRDGAGKWNVAESWKSRRLKPKFTNVAVRDSFVYGIDDGEFLVCLALADGELKWRSPRSKEFGHGQLLMVDDRLLVQTEDGELVLAEASPDEYRETGRIPVLPGDTTSWNTPVLWGKQVIVRNDREAACYELPTIR